MDRSKTWGVEGWRCQSGNVGWCGVGSFLKAVSKWGGIIALGFMHDEYINHGVVG